MLMRRVLDNKYTQIVFIVNAPLTTVCNFEGTNHLRLQDIHDLYYFSACSHGFCRTSYQTAGYVEQSYMQQPYMPMSYSQPSFPTAPAAPQVTAPSYNVEMFQPTTSQTTSYAAPANCPAGTTAQSDGTCLQGSGISTSSYSSTYSTPTYSTQSYSTPSYSGSYITSGATENCPAGTTSSSDGTCLMGADTSYQSSTYSGPTYGSSNSVGNGVAPALSTHSFNDYNWGSNDTSWGSNSYVSPGTRSVDAPYNSPSTDITPSYLPYRK